MATILKGRAFESYDQMLKFFNDSAMSGGLASDLTKLPSQIHNPQYIDGLWYLFYTGSDSGAP